MDPQSAKMIGAGIALLGMIGAGIGLGTIFGNLIAAVGRNPAARDVVFPIGLLGFALTEAIAIFALLISILILFVA